MSAIRNSEPRLDADQIPVPWVLVFGGVTRVGNRRARRAIDQAAGEGWGIVWFDGFCERSDKTGERVPVKGADTMQLTVVEFSQEEERTLSGRLRLGTVWRRNRIGQFFWTRFGRRLGLILRPRACWKVVASDVHQLRTVPAPCAIVYGDEFALTSAWYAGRMWSSPPIGTVLSGPTT